MRRALGVILVVVALMATACSSDSDDAGDSNENTETEETAPPLPGEPVKIGLVNTEGQPGLDLVDFREGADAAVQYLNDEGIGVLGRPVELVHCNTDADTAKARACGQEMVEAGVAAVMAFDPLWGDNGLPITAEAGIPFTGVPISNAGFLDATSRPFYGSSATAFPGLTEYALTEIDPLESVSIVYADLAAGELAANALVGDLLRAEGVDVKLVPESIGTPDFTSAVAEALSTDPDALVILQSESDCGRVLDAALSLGVEQPIMTASCDTSALSDDELSDLTIIGVEGFDSRSETEDAILYREAAEKYAPDSLLTHDGTMGFGVAMTTAALIDEVGTTEATDLMAFLETTTGFPVFMGTEYNTARCASLSGIELGACAVDVRILVTEDGEKTDTGAWISGY